MKRTTVILLALLVVVISNAQKISREYNNVSMSEVLRDLNQSSRNYTINFMYNELEDFRVTTSIRHLSVEDAILQAIGFYPIRVVRRGDNELYVECTHKTDKHLTGTIIDEQGQPVAYANITLLHPSDSTILCGGVSNEAGLFVIPYEADKVLARISYVGYKTVYRLCDKPEILASLV